METPKIYVGTYAKYNAGSIAGKWLDLTEYSTVDEFFEACKKVHKDESDPEFMFQDYECFPEELYSEAMSRTDAEILIGYANLNPDDRELLDEYVNATGNMIELDDVEDIERIQGNLFCQLDGWDFDEEMGEYVVDNGLLYVPDELESYVDYEKIGRDYLMDMSVSDNGFVFTNY